MDTQTHRQTDGQMNGRTDGRTNGRRRLCFRMTPERYRPFLECFGAVEVPKSQKCSQMFAHCGPWFVDCVVSPP